MATYNRAHYFSRSIGSVVQQTFDDWELIVIDDGSNDGTFGAILAYQKEHDRIRYLRHSRRGPALSRNTGILNAVGDYITFLDSDDEYLPIHLEGRLAYFAQHPEIDFIHGGFEVIGDPTVPDIRNIALRIPLIECAWEGSYFGKREIYFQANGFTSSSHHDLASGPDFVERIAKEFRVEKITTPRTVIYHHDTPDGVTRAFL